MNTKEISQKLITLRGNKTREEVAIAIGVSLSAISMYENGERVPRDEIKIKIAKFYNESVDAIFFSH